MIGTGELVIIGFIIVLLFGSSQIPKVARSFGEGLKELKKAMKETKELDKVVQENSLPVEAKNE